MKLLASSMPRYFVARSQLTYHPCHRPLRHQGSQQAGSCGPSPHFQVAQTRGHGQAGFQTSCVQSSSLAKHCSISSNISKGENQNKSWAKTSQSELRMSHCHRPFCRIHIWVKESNQWMVMVLLSRFPAPLQSWIFWLLDWLHSDYCRTASVHLTEIILIGWTTLHGPVTSLHSLRWLFKLDQLQSFTFFQSDLACKVGARTGRNQLFQHALALSFHVNPAATNSIHSIHTAQ